MFLDRFRCLHGLRNAPAFLVTVACSMALIACGGGGGGSNSTGPGPGSGAANPAPKPAELSLVVGNIQTFNGTGAKARITQPDGIAVDSADTVMGQIGSLYNPTYLTTESNSSLLAVTDGTAIVRSRLQ